MASPFCLEGSDVDVALAVEAEEEVVVDPACEDRAVLTLCDEHPQRIVAHSVALVRTPDVACNRSHKLGLPRGSSTSQQSSTSRKHHGSNNAHSGCRLGLLQRLLQHRLSQ